MLCSRSFAQPLANTSLRPVGLTRMTPSRSPDPSCFRLTPAAALAPDKSQLTPPSGHVMRHSTFRKWRGPRHGAQQQSVEYGDALLIVLEYVGCIGLGIGIALSKRNVIASRSDEDEKRKGATG